MENLSTNVVPFLSLILKAGLILLFIFITTFVKASYTSGVVINEIAWMGTETSYNDEWVELYNYTNLPITLDGWSLKAVDGNPEINLTGTVPSKGFYLLERTDDNTLSYITANQIYTGALSNKGEYLTLFDGENNLIDEVNCSDSWFTGNNSTKQTMERVNPQLSGNDSENWQLSQEPRGTPKTQNSTKLTKIQSPQVEDEKITEVGPPQVITYPSGIAFNEILPSPEGPDAENEWIEILNKNDFKVDLSEWKISDKIGRTNTYIFPNSTKIDAKGFLILSRKETKITLNNSGDGLNLIQPNNNLIDSVTYKKAFLGQSYSLTNSGWVWTATLTPGSDNILEDSKAQEGKEKDEIKKDEAKEELAAVGKQVFEEGFSFFNVFLIALVLAIFSAIVILFLKKKIKKFDFFSKLD